MRSFPAASTLFSAESKGIFLKNFESVRPGSAFRVRRSSGEANAAVVVPLVSLSDDVPGVLFTKRSLLLSDHRGEISFPGGRIDEGETTQQVFIPSVLHCSCAGRTERVDRRSGHSRLLSPSLEGVATDAHADSSIVSHSSSRRLVLPYYSFAEPRRGFLQAEIELSSG